MQAQDIMTKKVITIKATTPLVEIADLMKRHNISSLPVVNSENQIIGIIGEQDLISHDHDLHLPSYIQFLELLSKKGEAEEEINKDLKKIAQLPAKAMMGREIAVVELTTDVRVIAAIFTERKVSSVPVIDKERRIKGIISRVDLLNLMRRPKFSRRLGKKPSQPINYHYRVLKIN